MLEVIVAICAALSVVVPCVLYMLSVSRSNNISQLEKHLALEKKMYRLNANLLAHVNTAIIDLKNETVSKEVYRDDKIELHKKLDAINDTQKEAQHKTDKMNTGITRILVKLGIDEVT